LLSVQNVALNVSDIAVKFKPIAFERFQTLLIIVGNASVSSEQVLFRKFRILCRKFQTMFDCWSFENRVAGNTEDCRSTRCFQVDDL